MYFVKTELRRSPLDGQGLFTTHEIPVGTIVGAWGYRAEIIDEESLAAREGQSRLLERTGARWFGSYFLHKASLAEEDADEFVNHAPDPNLLYVCGWLVTRRDVHAGEELTIDYRHYFRTGTEEMIGTDHVVGRSPKQSLLTAITELKALLERMPDDWTGAPPR